MTELELDFEPTGAPKQITRHPDSLLRKARTHKVIPLPNPDRYSVISGGSGSVYTVDIFKDGAACTCDWARKHDPDGIQRGNSICSHTLAAMEYVAAQDRRKLVVKLDNGKGNGKAMDGVLLRKRRVHYKQKSMFSPLKYRKKGK